MKRLSLIFLTIILLIIVGFSQKMQALSFPFVDEQDNFAIGKYLLKEEIIYEDIITNHQPLTYILSAAVQKIRPSNTTFSLLVNHRMALFFWTSIWALVLVWYFGLGGFLAVIIFELTKSDMFGNLFLAESMVAYPLLFITGIFLQNTHLEKLTLIILGISFTVVLFTLSPIWPALLLLMLLLIYKLKNQPQKKFIYIALGILIVTLFVAKFSSISGYIQQTIFINLTYTIPQYHDGTYKESWVATIFKSFITPVFSFTKDATSVIWIIRVLTLMLVVNIVLLIRKDKKKLALTVLFLLGLSNIRFIYPGDNPYNSFHLIPWYSLFIFVTVMLAIKQKKIVNVALIVIVLMISLRYGVNNLFVKKDMQIEYTTNYSTHTDIGQIIGIMKNSKDTLFVSPNAWLVYWQSDVSHLPKLYGYYTWMSGIPRFHTKITESFEKNPPTFFYCENCKGLDLGKYLSKYQEIKRNGMNANLFVINEKIKGLTDAQKEQLKFYGID